MKKTFGLILMGMTALSCFAQAPKMECHPEKSHEFDFWIGHWKVTSNGNVAGYNRIEPILEGCVLQENWEGKSGNNGSSFNFYNPIKKQWEQFWVWRNGRTMHFKGHFKNGKMVLKTEIDTPQGKVKHRITWTPNADGSVRQHWENIPVDKTEWQNVFDGHYTKVVAK